jgi:primosomal protein N' (replication factor Y)
VRWDSDVASGKGIHELIFQKLVKHEADVLIGTQMIAKGLDLPQVTLAGVLNADIGLNLPDFRAGERTFQLTCQIAGRAGRGLAAGRVIFQTYSPDYYAIRAAAKHDYQEFYEKEIEFRRTVAYPPFNQLANLLISHTNNQTCQREAEKVYELITLEKDRRGIPNLRIIGPIPAFIPRIRGHYRWQIVLCGHGLSQFLNEITFPKGLVIDIDPATMI